MDAATLLTSLLSLSSIIQNKNIEKVELTSRKTWENEYDFIIIGSGAAGSVVASRLAEKPEFKILLLEAGGGDSIVTEIPAMFPSLRNVDWSFGQTEPQTRACLGSPTKSTRWVMAKILGGGTTRNAMIYNRGSRWDYERWKTEYKLNEWGWDQVLPYFKKSEDNQDEGLFVRGKGSKYHQKGGLWTISSLPDDSVQTKAFLQAAAEQGYQLTDINGDNEVGSAILQRSWRNGSRCSVVKAFLEPKMREIAKNLHIVTNATVTKILIETSGQEKRATGVQIERDGKTFKIYAKKEVILSAGAIGSPRLLLLSGIGDTDHLKSVGIAAVHHLKGVGKNLHDHVWVWGLHFTVNVTTPEDNRFLLSSVQQYFVNGSGPLTQMYQNEGAVINFKTSLSSTKNKAPDVMIKPILNFIPSPGGDVTSEIWDEVYKPYATEQIYTFFIELFQIKSRGFIKLRSSKWTDPPIIDPKYLSHDDDIKRVVEAFKFVDKIAKSSAFETINMKPFESIIPLCREHLPRTSDNYLECMARHFSKTDYHYVGSCRMGLDKDENAVVNQRLEVRGIKQLMIVDASVIPDVPTGNTMAPTVMIGEKAAQLIKEKYAHHKNVSSDVHLSTFVILVAICSILGSAMCMSKVLISSCYKTTHEESKKTI